MPTNSFWSNILQLLFGLGVNKTNDVAEEKVDKSSIQLRFPFFIKAPMVMLGLYLLFYLLQILQDILVPLCFALLIAVILNPIVNKLIN